MATLSKAEYLRKYMSGEDGGKKKKRRPKKAAANAPTRLRIVDDDLDIASVSTRPSEGGGINVDEDVAEDKPVIVDLVDERPAEIRNMELFRKTQMWRTLGADDDSPSSEQNIKKEPRERHDSESDQSPPRRKRHDFDSDQSPPRRKRHDSDSDQSPPRRKRHDSDSDQSPPRRKRHDSDQSPPRRKSIKKEPRGRHDSESDQSPPRRKRHDSDQSPPRRKSIKKEPRGRHDSDSDQSPQRRKRHDSDQSPPRRKSIKKEPRGRHDSESDQSPPRRKRHDSDSDQSPPRRHPKESKGRTSERTDSKKKPESSSGRKRPSRFHSDSDSSPPRKKGNEDIHAKDERGRAKKTLSGATAGLSSARQMREEARIMREREDEMFRNMDDADLGKNAKTKVRTKKRTQEEEEKEAEEAARKEELDRKYKLWNKGLAQVEREAADIADAVHEMSKPLTRRADDEDLESQLRSQDRDGDPMLNYLRGKKAKADSKKKALPKYSGPQPPMNRFGLWPGYRWDGVDRSNGFEKQIILKKAEKTARKEMAYKWSTEDM